jgi:ABC-2 type transport system ATP-binding protein
MTAILELNHITKFFRHQWTYRQLRAVEDLSFSVAAGEVYGLIGHNGAGKTTTFKMIVGLLRPSSGELLWNGTRLEKPSQRGDIGFSPEQPYFYDYLTVRETLNLYGQLYGLRGAERHQLISDLAERFQITAKLDVAMRTLSKGNLQRVAIAQAIMHRPKLAILDEPMSGLDPAGRKEMRDLIASLRAQGTAVIFSSHVLSDAEALCDRVGILAGGQLREVVDLRTRSGAPIGYSLVIDNATPLLLEKLHRLTGTPPSGGPSRWSVLLPDQAAVRAALEAAQACDAAIETLLPVRPSLEEHFLRYAKGAADDN